MDPQRLVSRTRELIRIPSVGGEEGAAQERVATWLRDDGLDVDRWAIDLDELARHPSFSAEVERSSAQGVVGMLDGGDGPTLVLNGHVDVVPAGALDDWHHPPFAAVYRDGTIHGRGSADMKGGLVAAVEALRAVREAGIRLRGRVLLQSVVGEEDGGLGTLASILRGHTGDGAVVLEPTGLRLVTAQAGSLNFRLTVPGRAVHAALRTEGISAVEKFEVLHRALRTLERDRNERFADDPRFSDHPVPLPISVGTVRAGDWPSSVPDRLVAEGRYGVGLGEALEDARAEFQQAVRSAADADPWLRENPPGVEWWGGRFAPAETDPSEPVVEALRRAHRLVTGGEAEPGGVPYGSDMRLLVREGSTPAVLYGPGDVRRAHGPEESVPAEELVRAARVIANLIVGFCGAA